MRVLHVTTDYPYLKDGKVMTYGGLGVCAMQLIEGLKSRGVLIDVLSSYADFKDEYDNDADGIFRTWYFKLGKSRNWKLTHTITMLFKFLRLINKNKYDIIHVHNPPAGILTTILAKHANIPSIMTMHGPWAKVRERMKDLAIIIELLALKNSDIVTFDGVEVMDEYYEDEKFISIVNAVDTDKFILKDRDGARMRFGLEEDKLTFLYSGRNVYGKTIDIIKNMARKFPDYYFVIAGTESNMIDFECDNLRYVGTISNDEMPELYAACDALILNTMAESLSRAALECMSCGKPVLLSDILPNFEVVGDSGAGLFFSNEHDLEVILSGVTRQDLIDISCGVRDYIKKNFSLGARIDKFINLYDDILKKECVIIKNG